MYLHFLDNMFCLFDMNIIVAVFVSKQVLQILRSSGSIAMCFVASSTVAVVIKFVCMCMCWKLVFWSTWSWRIQLYYPAGARQWGVPSARKCIDQWRLCSLCQVSVLCLFSLLAAMDRFTHGFILCCALISSWYLIPVNSFPTSVIQYLTLNNQKINLVLGMLLVLCAVV